MIVVALDYKLKLKMNVNVTVIIFKILTGVNLATFFPSSGNASIWLTISLSNIAARQETA